MSRARGRPLDVRSQRGGVLSGVLLITAFLAILGSALMSELSTNFLLSKTLMNRVANEATVNSAMELAFDSIQRAPFTAACPALRTPPTLNGLTAKVAYSSCSLVVDKGSLPAVKSVAAATGFGIDGTSSSYAYIVPDAAGLLHGFPFAYAFPGGQSHAWTYDLSGTVTAPPLSVDSGGDALDYVPLDQPSGDHVVAFLHESPGGTQPSAVCDMASNGSVISAPAASVNPRSIVYFGDTEGNIFAFNASPGATCGERDEDLVLGGAQPIVAGPVVVAGFTSSTDRLFFVVSDGASSTLVQYRYASNNRRLTLIATLSLPAPNAVGMALDSTGSRIGVTFAAGRVALVQLTRTSNSIDMDLTASVTLPGHLANAPTWCNQCAGGGGLLGVGSRSGFYLLDTSLGTYASFTGSGAPTTPGVNAGGDWFVAGDDGNLYELRTSVRGTMTIAADIPASGAAATSSPIVHTCAAGLCVYHGAADARAYLLPLDARDAIITACVTSVSGDCVANPRLWAQVEIGSAGDPRSVVVTGFSYYSP